MYPRITRCLATLVFGTVLGSLPCAAAEVAGVTLEDKTQLGNSPLTLNGAGLRSRFFFKVYVAALYLPHRELQAQTILQCGAPKRVQLVMLRDVSAESFMEALHKGIAANLSTNEQGAIKTRLDSFSQLVLSLGKARKGDVFLLDETSAGTQLSLNGKVQGQVIPGDDLYRALLKVWLGNNPVQDDLKRALLGGSE